LEESSELAIPLAKLMYSRVISLQLAVMKRRRMGVEPDAVVILCLEEVAKAPVRH